MRALILFAGATLALTACSKHDQAGTTRNADESLSADTIVANDVTAIDAVTADASNMAADVNYEGLDEATGNEASNAAAPSKPHSGAHSAAAKAPSTEPAATDTPPPGNYD